MFKPLYHELAIRRPAGPAFGEPVGLRGFRAARWQGTPAPEQHVERSRRRLGHGDDFADAAKNLDMAHFYFPGRSANYPQDFYNAAIPRPLRTRYVLGNPQACAANGTSVQELDRPWLILTFTRAPSGTLLWPAASNASEGKNASDPPATVTNPKPLSALNHLTRASIASEPCVRFGLGLKIVRLPPRSWVIGRGAVCRCRSSSHTSAIGRPLALLTVSRGGMLQPARAERRKGTSPRL